MEDHGEFPMRHVPQIALDFLEKQEACVLHVYDDAQPTKMLFPTDKVLGTLTAGWGHTGNLNIGMEVTLEMAQAWLAQDAAKAAERLADVVSAPTIEELTDHQYGALISFVFNLGADPKWTIWKRLNAHAFDQVPGEMMKFVNQSIGGQTVKVQGLVNRRAAEVAFWSINEPGTSPALPSSSVTRGTVTPPTPSDPVPASKSKALILSGVGAVAGAGPAIDQVTHVISPYAEHSDYVGKVLGILAGVSAICATAGLAYLWILKKNGRN